MTNKTWKIEIRDRCKVCGLKLPNMRYRTYCSKECRIARNNQKQKDSGYLSEWYKKKRDNNKKDKDFLEKIKKIKNLELIKR